MKHMEMKMLLPSRMEEAKTSNKAGVAKNETSVSKIHIGMEALRLCLPLTITAIAYHLLGAVAQRLDPTAGWLDTGTLSLPLFAAWSCLLGVSIAGLLPVIIGTIGRKGGIGKWKADKNRFWQLIVFAGYIALLCALL